METKDFQENCSVFRVTEVTSENLKLSPKAVSLLFSGSILVKQFSENHKQRPLRKMNFFRKLSECFLTIACAGEIAINARCECSQAMVGRYHIITWLISLLLAAPFYPHQIDESLYPSTLSPAIILNSRPDF